MNDNVFAKATVIFIALFIRKNNFGLNVIKLMKNKCMWQYSFILALAYLLLTIFYLKSVEGSVQVKKLLTLAKA